MSEVAAQRIPWLALSAAGPAAAAGALLPIEARISGGVGTLAAFAVIALFVAPVVARAEWRAGTNGASPLLAASLRSSGAFWSTVFLSLLCAPLLHGASWRVAVALLAAGCCSALLVRFSGWAASVLGGVGVLGALVFAMTNATVPEIGWTLTSPRWSSLAEWLPAVFTPAVLAAGGLGHWTGAAAMPSRAGRVTWFPAGLAVLVSLALLLSTASGWEQSGVVTTSAPELVLITAASLGFLLAILGRRPVSGPPALRLLAIVVGVLWFAGPAWGTVPIVTSTILPIGVAVHLGLLALGQTGGVRWVLALAAVLPASGGLLAFPGLPESALEAAMVAIVVVVAIWVSGTRAMLRSPS